MGQDYSYSQPSSSSASLDITSILEAEAKLYADEATSSYNAQPVEYTLVPEADEGIPRTCYCGGDPILRCSYTAKDPYRRYFTCHNVDDGDCHVWKWFDVAAIEEMKDFQRQLMKLKEQGKDNEQKLLNLEKTVNELSKKKSRATQMVCLFVVIGLVLLLMRVVAKASKEDEPSEFLK